MPEMLQVPGGLLASHPVPRAVLTHCQRSRSARQRTSTIRHAARRPYRVMPGPAAADRPSRVPGPRRRRPGASSAASCGRWSAPANGSATTRGSPPSRSRRWPRCPTPRILELGAGHGGLSAKLLEMHPTAHVTVTDLEADSVGGDRGGAAGLRHRATVRTMDATEIDAADGALRPRRVRVVVPSPAARWRPG